MGLVKMYIPVDILWKENPYLIWYFGEKRPQYLGGFRIALRWEFRKYFRQDAVRNH